jgi:hypothetical protein
MPSEAKRLFTSEVGGTKAARLCRRAASIL